MQSDDELFSALYETIKQSEAAKTVDVPTRVKFVQEAYNAIKNEHKDDENLNVILELHDSLMPSVANIIIEGKDIQIRNMKLFNLLLKFCYTFAVYPKTNGNVRMAFSFDGLKKRRA